MRWVSPFIHQPGEHGCHRRTEAKWESSPSSVFVPQTLSFRFPSLIGWLWNTQKLARTTPSLSGCSRIKSSFFSAALVKSGAFSIGKREQRYYFTFSSKLHGKVETLNLSCKTIQSTPCLRQFMPLKSSAVALHLFSTQIICQACRSRNIQYLNSGKFF